METIKNVTQLLIAKNINKTAIANLVINSYTQIADGEVCVVSPFNNMQVTTAGYPTNFPSAGFKLIQRSGTKLIHSDIIKPGTVRRLSIGLQSAEVQKIDYIGFNGTSGSLDAIANNVYSVRLYVRGSTITDFMQQKIKEGFYKSSSLAASFTQEAVANGLVQSLIANFSREPEQIINFDIINSAVTAAIGTGVGTVTFTKGSKTVLANTDVDDNTVNTALVVGEYIGAAVAVGTPIYKIVSINAANDTLQLDRPFTGTTVTAANDAVRRVKIAGLANFGIRLQGIDRPFVVGKFKSSVADWKTTIDFGGPLAAVTESVKAYPGIGTYQQIASIEKELQADEYVYRSFVEGVPVDRADAILATPYDIVSIEYDDITQSGLGVNVHSPKTLLIAQAENGGQADVAAIGWITVLNHIIVTTWGVPGAVAVVPTA